MQIYFCIFIFSLFHFSVNSLSFESKPNNSASKIFPSLSNDDPPNPEPHIRIKRRFGGGGGGRGGGGFGGGRGAYAGRSASVGRSSGGGGRTSSGGFLFFGGGGGGGGSSSSNGTHDETDGLIACLIFLVLLYTFITIVACCTRLSIIEAERSQPQPQNYVRPQVRCQPLPTYPIVKPHPRDYSLYSNQFQKHFPRQMPLKKDDSPPPSYNKTWAGEM